MPRLNQTLFCLFFLAIGLAAQEVHDHGVPEKLGTVTFPISCSSGVQDEFNRGIALLHSFAYRAAESAFREAAQRDPHCAMAHWGIAMAQFHQLWDPPLSRSAMTTGKEEMQRARTLGTSSTRERRFIDALSAIYPNDPAAPYRERASRYERGVCELAGEEREDTETQVFCALALLANASAMDKTHGKQKRAAEILEPLSRTYPEHPGIAHYLIHAYDNAELAPKGVAAARVYASIAASAPHALHMPSHIFTRLGMWDDSIASNRAARKAAREQRDTGEELHAMDYLVYAYLQTARYPEAAEVISQLAGRPDLNVADFKVGYAATAMPIRYAVERSQWADAVKVRNPAGAPPHIVALAVWARGLGFARTGRTAEAEIEARKLQECESQLRESGLDYWAEQTGILALEVRAWTEQAKRRHDAGLEILREAANREDAVEKLPVTPGPILPAREQLGYLLLEQHQPATALSEFQIALGLAPGRRAALAGAELCRRAQETNDAH